MRACVCAGARHHNVDPAYCTMLDAQPSYDKAGLKKRVGTWAVAAMLLWCTVWLVPLLTLLSVGTK